jgi:hypothetical protein
MRGRRAALAADTALKVVLVGLLVFAAARQDLPQFHDKSMMGRAIGYPLAALVVPIAWFALSRRSPRRFPVAVDILIVLTSRLVSSARRSPPPVSRGSADDRWQPRHETVKCYPQLTQKSPSQAGMIRHEDVRGCHRSIS